MKIKILLLTLLIISFVTCKSSNSGNNSTQKPIENNIYYIKSNGSYGFKNESDLNKDLKNINYKNYKYFVFGNKFTGIKSKTIGDKTFYLLQLPDKTEPAYWVQSDNLCEKFIIINKNDVTAYIQPGMETKSSIKLQVGDFGYFVREEGDWVLVDFNAFRPYEKDGQRSWVGQKWINEGYITDILAAKEANYLYWSYYYTFYKKVKNKEKAIEFAKKALEINNGEETEITFVVKNFLSELQSGKYF